MESNDFRLFPADGLEAPFNIQKKKKKRTDRKPFNNDNSIKSPWTVIYKLLRKGGGELEGRRGLIVFSAHNPRLWDCSRS